MQGSSQLLFFFRCARTNSRMPHPSRFFARGGTSRMCGEDLSRLSAPRTDVLEDSRRLFSPKRAMSAVFG
jgi:hypothetical protein